jgi:para-nitrobenzyl esterase
VKSNLIAGALAPALAAAAVMALASAASAQQPQGTGPAMLALQALPAKARLTVTTPAFVGGGDIPLENTQYKTNIFPGLAWSKGPDGTRSYAVIMQDNDLMYLGAFVLHWTLFNVPGSTTSLPVGMTTAPAGAVYGPNYKGPSVAYTGPRTPPGHRDHYHFEIFALDTVLPVDAAAGGFNTLVDAMKGHVLASGEVVGIGQPPEGTK